MYPSLVCVHCDEQLICVHSREQLDQADHEDQPPSIPKIQIHKVLRIDFKHQFNIFKHNTLVFGSKRMAH